MNRYEPMKDEDGRDVSVQGTSLTSGVIGIHSWQDGNPMIAEDDVKAKPSKSIFLNLENARRLRDELIEEIRWQEGYRPS